ncbi:MAG: hypothetical protein JWQ35_1007 [Bacteriovoracaceae bacterium]|nr:hypothetical protein [Bacteriovoracaceae bacterium]
MNSLLLIGSPLLFLGAVQIVLAFICLSRGRRENLLPIYAGVLAFISATWCITIGIFYTRAAMGLEGGIFYRLAWISSLGIPIVITVAMDLRKKVHRIERIINWISYGFWGLVSVLAVTTNLVDSDPLSLIPYKDGPGRFEIPVRILCAINSAFLLYQLFMARKESVGIKRQQTAYFLLGTAIYLTGNLIIVFPYAGTFYFDPGLGAYLSVPWNALTIYAITKHRLFNIRLVLSRVFSASIITGFFTVFHLLVFRLLRNILDVDMGIIVATFATAILAFTSPFMKYVFKFSANLFFGSSIDYQMTLKKSSEALVSILNLDDLIRKFIEVTRKTLGIDEAGFFLMNENKFELRYALALPAGAESFKLESSSLMNWVNEKKQVLVREEQDGRIAQSTFDRLDQDLENLGAEIAIPVFFNGILSGLLTLGFKTNKDAFFQEDIMFLETLSSQVALGIENARLFAESTTDGLTGLYHQKYFKARVHSEFMRIKRSNATLALMILDIDHFKRINDTYGHLMGDKVLKGVAKVIHLSFRIEDIVARYGGEEFGVLLCEPHTRGAIESAERVRKKIEQLEFDNGIKVTISIGVRILEKGNDCATDIDLIQGADDALYEAKNGGRNQVVVFQTTSKLRQVK